MFDYSRVQNYYIACGCTDMRKQIDGLVAVVELQFGRKLDETTIFLFCGRRADLIKALYWDGTGYVLLYKHLVEKRFQWPRNEQELKLLTKQDFVSSWKDCPLSKGKPSSRGNRGLSAEKKFWNSQKSKRILALAVESYKYKNLSGRRRTVWKRSPCRRHHLTPS